MSFKESVIMPRQSYDRLVAKLEGSGKSKKPGEPRNVEASEERKKPRQRRKVPAKTNLTSRSRLMKYQSARVDPIAESSSAKNSVTAATLSSGDFAEIKKSFSPAIHHNVQLLMSHLRTHCSKSFSLQLDTMEIEIERQRIVRSNFVDILRFFLEGRGRYLSDFTLSDDETIDSEYDSSEISQIIRDNAGSVGDGDDIAQMFEQFTIPRGGWAFLNLLRESLPNSGAHLAEVFPFILKVSIKRTDIFKRAFINPKSQTLMAVAIARDRRYAAMSKQDAKKNEGKQRRSMIELDERDADEVVAHASKFEGKRKRQTEDPSELIKAFRRDMEKERKAEARREEIEFFKGFSKKLGFEPRFEKQKRSKEAEAVRSARASVRGSSSKEGLVKDMLSTHELDVEQLKRGRKRNAKVLKQIDSMTDKRLKRARNTVLDQLNDTSDLIESSFLTTLNDDSSSSGDDSSVVAPSGERVLRNRDMIKPAEKYSP